MNANQWLLGVGVPSLFVIVFFSLGVALEEARAAWNNRLRRLIFPINFRPRISLSVRSARRRGSFGGQKCGS